MALSPEAVIALITLLVTLAALTPSVIAICSCIKKRRNKKKQLLQNGKSTTDRFLLQTPILKRRFKQSPKTSQILTNLCRRRRTPFSYCNPCTSSLPRITAYINIRINHRRLGTDIQARARLASFSPVNDLVNKPPPSVRLDFGTS